MLALHLPEATLDLSVNEQCINTASSLSTS